MKKKKRVDSLISILNVQYEKKKTGCSLSIGVLDGASSLKDLTEYADCIVPSIAKLPKILFQWALRAKKEGQPVETFKEWKKAA